MKYLKVFTAIALSLLISCENPEVLPADSTGEVEVVAVPGENPIIEMVEISPYPSQGMGFIFVAGDDSAFNLLDAHFEARISVSQMTLFFQQCEVFKNEPTNPKMFFRFRISYTNGESQILKVPLGTRQGESLYWLFVDCLGPVARQELFKESAPREREAQFFDLLK